MRYHDAVRAPVEHPCNHIGVQGGDPDDALGGGSDVPGDMGFVVHAWTPEMKGWAGIYQRRDHLAASAVDMVVAQLTQNERGVPAVPRQIMIPPEWVDGPSVRFQ